MAKAIVAHQRALKECGEKLIEKMILLNAGDAVNSSDDMLNFALAETNKIYIKGKITDSDVYLVDQIWAVALKTIKDKK